MHQPLLSLRIPQLPIELRDNDVPGKLFISNRHLSLREDSYFIISGRVFTQRIDYGSLTLADNDTAQRNDDVPRFYCDLVFGETSY